MANMPATRLRRTEDTLWPADGLSSELIWAAANVWPTLYVESAGGTGSLQLERWPPSGDVGNTVWGGFD